jgi:hypothetical protein
MMNENSHIIFIDSIESDVPRHLVHGVVAGPHRFVDFPDRSWDGWVLNAVPKPVTARLRTVESLVTPAAGVDHPEGTPEERSARRRLNICLAGVQNRIPLTIESGPTRIPIPSFLVTDPTMQPSTYGVVVKLLLSRFAESADFQAWVLYNRSMDRAMAADPDIGHLFVDRCTDRLVSDGASMSFFPGLLLPIEVDLPGRSVYGVVRLVESLDSNQFFSNLYLSDRCERMCVGAILRRVVRFVEDGKVRECRSEVARVAEVRAAEKVGKWCQFYFS